MIPKTLSDFPLFLISWGHIWALFCNNYFWYKKKYILCFCHLSDVTIYFFLTMQGLLIQSKLMCIAKPETLIFSWILQKVAICKKHGIFAICLACGHSRGTTTIIRNCGSSRRHIRVSGFTKDCFNPRPTTLRRSRLILDYPPRPSWARPLYDVSGWLLRCWALVRCVVASPLGPPPCVASFLKHNKINSFEVIV